jgi:hypothetical protein
MTSAFHAGNVATTTFRFILSATTSHFEPLTLQSADRNRTATSTWPYNFPTSDRSQSA